MTTQTIPIELSRPGPLPVVYATAGDVYSRQVTLQLYNGGAPYTPPEGTTCLIGWRRQDGTAGNYDKITEADGESTHPAWQLDGSALTVELSKQLCAAAGDVAMNVALVGTDGSRLHTWELTCRVERGAVEDSEDPSLPSESASQAAARAEASAKAAAASAAKAEASEPANAADRAETAARQAEAAQTDAAASQSAAAQSADQARQAAQQIGTAAAGAAASASAAAQSAQQAQAAAGSINTSLILPAGTVYYFALEEPPAGYLVCNGAAVSRTTYANLFQAIGTRFGAGDGATTFNLPDLRGT